MVFDRIQSSYRANHKFLFSDPQRFPEFKITTGQKPLRIDSVRYECQLAFWDVNRLLEPTIKIFRNCDELSGAECQQPARQVPSVDLSVRIRDVAAMLAMDESRP